MVHVARIGTHESKGRCLLSIVAFVICMECPFSYGLSCDKMAGNDATCTGERCVVPTPVPAEHKLTAVWTLSDAPSKFKKCRLNVGTLFLWLDWNEEKFKNLRMLLQSMEER